MELASNKLENYPIPLPESFPIPLPESFPIPLEVPDRYPEQSSEEIDDPTEIIIN